MINYYEVREGKKVDEDDIFMLGKKLDDKRSMAEIKSNIEKALSQNLIWVAEDRGRIVGYQLCELFNKDHHNFPNSIFLSELYVVKSYRRKGIGSHLIKMALKNKFPQKYKYFSLTHDPKKNHLRKFYESFGFEYIGETKAGNAKLIKKI